MRRVAIVVPIWKEWMTPFEKISFQQCCLIFKKKVICIVTFRNVLLDNYISILRENNAVFQIIYFSKKKFISIKKYNSFMMSLFFYLRFIKYKYILIYQLDCFVFRDELDHWVDKGYSYIGAPWLEGYSLANYGNAIIGGGNGGFSLRKVKDHLKVLLTFKLIQYSKKNNVNTFFLMNHFHKNEDIFWSKIAAITFPWFTVPDWDTSVLFSIEVQPRYFFELNNNKIPFGCHAWWRYDLNFWKSYIEKFGYRLIEEKN